VFSEAEHFFTYFTIVITFSLSNSARVQSVQFEVAADRMPKNLALQSTQHANQCIEYSICRQLDLTVYKTGDGLPPSCHEILEEETAQETIIRQDEDVDSSAGLFTVTLLGSIVQR